VDYVGGEVATCTSPVFIQVESNTTADNSDAFLTLTAMIRPTLHHTGEDSLSHSSITTAWFDPHG